MIAENTEAFEFTNLAENEFYDIIENSDFFNQESETIYNYLKNKIGRIHFCDYLKRFIYRRVHPGGRSRQDVDYREYIIGSFRENKVPSSMAESGTKLSAAAGNWLSQHCVTRDTIFLIGFGLKMSSSEVSEFLINAIGDMDFDFNDPYEVIYWYCFRNELSYADMKRLTAQYEDISGVDSPSKTNLTSPSMIQDYLMRIVSEEELMNFLGEYKGTKQSETIREVFESLYDEACEIIAQNINYENENMGKTLPPKSPEGISALDIERRIYAGVPIDSHGNLCPMTQSVLCGLFGEKRFNRKRISDLKKGIKQPERFDVVTLCFIIAAEKTLAMRSDVDVKRNYYNFVRNTNETLTRCRFGHLYAANPYENFLMMCMMCQDPMLTFSDIWEYSYNPDKKCIHNCSDDEMLSCPDTSEETE